MKTLVTCAIVGLLSIAITTAYVRAADEPSEEKTKEKEAAKKPAEKAGKKADQVRLYVEGAYCAGCAAVLTEALSISGVKNTSKISANAGKGYVIVLADFGHDKNLSQVADAVKGADTPHKRQAKPGVSLELFAKLDKESAAKAIKSLAAVEGVDAKGSAADPKRGVISVRLAGGDKPVSVAGIVSQLKADGIAASIVTDSVRRILDPPKEAAEDAKEGEKGDQK